MLGPPGAPNPGLNMGSSAMPAVPGPEASWAVSSSGSKLQFQTLPIVKSRGDVDPSDAEQPGRNEEEPMTAEDDRQLNLAAFEDSRWQNAMTFLKQRDDWGPARAHSVLVQGAKHFGVWDLDPWMSQTLSKHLLTEEEVTDPSLALEQLIERSKDNDEEVEAVADRLAYTVTPQANSVSSTEMPSVAETQSTRRILAKASTMTAKHVSKYLEEKKKKRAVAQSLMQEGIEWKASLLAQGSLRKWKALLHVLVFGIGLAYAFKVVLDMYPEAIDNFGWPVFFARMGGMMAACWTGILYWTMARGFLSDLYAFTRGNSVLVAPLDGHKDLHVMSGMALCATAIEHTVAHIIGTVPGIMKAKDASTLNAIIGCANKATTNGYLEGVDFGFLQWPACPFKEVPRTIEEVLFKTVPGLTGVLLLALLWAMYYTGNDKSRKNNFDLFWYVHNVGIILWPVLLFIHGTNGWIGIGFPLVAFTAFLPIMLFAWDRIGRGLRYFLFAGRAVKILHAQVRPGKGGGVDGALTYLQISPPPCLWRFKPGMYAFICMPQYAPLQWHPFTICSGRGDPTVNFLIAGVGDWTRELARSCLEALEKNSPLPMVAIDGPYMAPTQSALTKKVLVAVGAGVGITPFLSLMSTIISQLDTDDLPGIAGSRQGHGKFARLLEVHFYWMTRNADEFLFAQTQISRIVSSKSLMGKVFVHLHVTGKAPEKDASGFVFREALRRQNVIDRKLFKDALKEYGLEAMLGPALPMCWVNGAREDIMWTATLVWSHSKLREERSEASVSVCDAEAGTVSLPAKPSGASLQNSRSSGSLGSLGLISCDGDHYMVPIIFGRPDFATEIRQIGKARPGYNVHLYICANDTVVQGLQDVATVCNLHAEADTRANGAAAQQYIVHYERFG